MNLSKLEIESFNRIIAHEVHPKTKSNAAYAVTSTNLLEFNDTDRKILSTRLVEALSNSKKTFKLEFEDKSEDSIYYFLSNYTSIDDDKFIQKSQFFADELAEAHFRSKIPGGVCVIGDGMTKEGKNFFFIIKAELQEVFNIKGNELQVIEDVFLSPAKDFYKVGFFIEDGANYIPYMFDDLFNLQKKDLTEYFYSKFLGLTTDKNDKLKSKNFYDDTKLFIENHIDNMKDRIWLFKTIDILYREDTSGIISPKTFADNYLEGSLKTKFHKEVINGKYPHSFTKDISLLKNRLNLQRVTIPLSYSLNLVGSQEKMDCIDVIDNPSTKDIESLTCDINNGSIDKIIVLKQVTEKSEAILDLDNSNVN